MISIVIPVHNEEKRLGEARILDEYATFFENKKKSKEIDNFEILVVLNACKDRTEEIVKVAQKKYKEIRYLCYKQGGKGFAIIEGFRDALKRADLIGFVDADMATRPEAFFDLMKNIKGYDGVIASRRMKNSVINGKSFMRKITSAGFNYISRALFIFPFRDTQCGAKLFTKKAVEAILPGLVSLKWAFDVNLLYMMKRNNLQVKEIATVWEEKKGSKLNLIKIPIQMFSAIVRLRLVYSPFEFIVRGYDRILPEKMKIHNI